MWLGLSLVCFMLMVLLAAVSLIVSVISSLEMSHGSLSTGSWEEAATYVPRMKVYEPAYLPPGSGEPTLQADRRGPRLTVTYPGGLSVEENDRRSYLPEPDGDPVSVRGAREAYFSIRDGNERALIVDKGETQLDIRGAPGEESVKVAESLQPVQAKSGPRNVRLLAAIGVGGLLACGFVGTLVLAVRSRGR